MSAWSDFEKANIAPIRKAASGVGGKIFLGLSVAEIAQSDNKLKALIKTLLTLRFMGPSLALALTGAFSGMSKGIRSLVSDTGSLQAALAKLAQIQGFQRTFAPLLGGAEAARRKVAELVNFAANSNFSFGDSAEAARSLEVFTRGAYSGAGALKVIGDAAAASGNGITQTGDAVGEFYATLRAGQPIDAAAEKLRQMGLINDATAASLVNLQQSGAGVSRIFGDLTGALGQHAGGMGSAQGDLASVQAAHEQASTALQEKFASPFVEGEIQNTQNWTAAMQAVAPVVERVAGFLAVLTGGFETTQSWIAKTAAQSPVLRSALEGIVDVGAGLIAFVSTVSGLGFGIWLTTVAGAATTAAAGLITFTEATGLAAAAITGLGVAVRVAAIASGIGIAVAALATAVGIFYSFRSATSAQQKALEDLRKAHDQANAAMERQIASISTLQDRHEALTKALAEQTEAQLALNQAMAEHKSPAEIEEHRKDLEKKQADVAHVMQTPAGALAPSVEEQKRVQMEVERRRALQEQKWQDTYDQASPAQKIELDRAKAAELRERARRASVGVQNAAALAPDQADADLAVAKAQAELEGLRREQHEAPRMDEHQEDRLVPPPVSTELFADDTPVLKSVTVRTPHDYTAEQQEKEDALAAAQAKAASIGRGAAPDSSLYAAAKIQQLLAAQRLGTGSFSPEEESRLRAQAGAAADHPPAEGIPKAIANWQWQRAKAAKDEAEIPQNAAAAADLDDRAKTAEREQKLAEARATTERQIAELKERGFDRAQEELRLRRQQLQEELRDQQSLPGGGDPTKVDSLKGQLADNLREAQEQARAKFVAQSDVERGVAIGNAELHGNSDYAVNLKDFDSTAHNFEQFRSQFGEKDAAKYALSLGSQEIERSGREAERSGVVDSLQRIGGGGGIAGGDPMLGIAQRQADLQQRMADYLANLVDAQKGADDFRTKDPDPAKYEGEN